MLRTLAVNSIAASDLLNFKQRLAIYKRYGMTASDEAFIQSRVFFAEPSKLGNVSIGHKAFINNFCYIDNAAQVSIGQHTAIGPHVKILTTTHEIAGPERRSGYGCVRMPVTIGEGCWIGCNAVIFPGVTIGNGVVVGAGAVVTSDLEGDGVYCGVPAVLKRSLSEVVV